MKATQVLLETIAICPVVPVVVNLENVLLLNECSNLNNNIPRHSSDNRQRRNGPLLSHNAEAKKHRSEVGVNDLKFSARNGACLVERVPVLERNLVGMARGHRHIIQWYVIKPQKSFSI